MIDHQGSPWPYIPLSLQQPQLVQTTLQNQAENERRAAERQLEKTKATLPGPVAQLVRPTHASGLVSNGSEDSTYSHNSASGSGSGGGHSRSRSNTNGSMTGVKRSGAELSPALNDDGVDSIMAEAQKRASPRPRAQGIGQDLGLSAILAGEAPSATTAASAQEENASGVAITNGPLSKDVMMEADLEPTLADAQAAAAAKAGLKSTDASAANTNGTSTPTATAAAAPVQAPVPTMIGGAAVKTSDTHPINISPIVPIQLMERLAAGIYDRLAPDVRDELGSIASAGLAGPSQVGKDEHAQRQLQGQRLIRAQANIDLAEIVKAEMQAAAAENGAGGAACGTQEIVPLSQAQIQAQEALAEANAKAQAADAANTNGIAAPTSSPVGNLYLSSCPGKKVRLTGPVRGRGAICRNLNLDLKRIQEIGVGAIICCLDDEELAFLGAPWHEYESSADALGLDVIRIPVAEGFAPSCHVTIDRAITSVVMDYTLRGISVLVHCRGGVGRAGLIACTWMLKMGLVRSEFELEAGIKQGIESQQAEQKLANGGASTATALTNLSEEARQEVIVDTVERLVNTIRRRRSPKAIETAEQVKFIVEVSRGSLTEIQQSAVDSTLTFASR